MANALRKGHLMNRGTLMVLKRLIVTALGAFGMGALLAVGPVSAQQIPAPMHTGTRRLVLRRSRSSRTQPQTRAKWVTTG